MKTINEYKQIYTENKGKRDLLIKNEKELKNDICVLEKKKIIIEKTQVFIQEVARTTQEKLKFHIEDIVQMMLDACEFTEFKFVLDFSIERGKTVARLFFMKDDEETDPMNSTGGGVVDITAFALRIACWSLSKTDPIIIFDEPFKHLSMNLRKQAGEILKKLSETLKLQMVIVTHDPAIIDVSDRVFNVQLKPDGQWLKSEIT